MLRNLSHLVADQFAEYCTQAEECQQSADLFPEDRMGQEFAELARRWRSIVEQSDSRLIA